VGGFQNFLFFSGQPVHRHAQDLGKDHQLVVRHEAVPGLYLADGFPLNEHTLDLHPCSEVRLGDAFGRPHLVDAVPGDILLSLKIVNLHTQPLLGTLTVPRKRTIFVI
ncbi:Selenium metabolism protein YedF, partial [Dysosmobacter welbionis]